jgi:NTP pyrophosphatase (non-canonical NTP hydrolase)
MSNPHEHDVKSDPHEHDSSTPLSIGDAQRAVDAYIAQFAEGYWPPLTNLARLVEEVGELARELNHRFGHKTKKPGEPEQDLALELADILFVLVAIANEQKIDLEAAFHRVLEKYEVRDADRWPRAGPGTRY